MWHGDWKAYWKELHDDAGMGLTHVNGLKGLFWQQSSFPVYFHTSVTDFSILLFAVAVNISQVRATLPSKASYPERQILRHLGSSRREPE